MTKSDLIRIGVFYDGNFFYHVSNYYAHYHERKSRISISGLHEFIQHEIANKSERDARYCRIIDAHYFRGRLRALEANDRGMLLKERLFDDVLNREGVITHYLSLGINGEKGVDVALALEAYELSVHKKFDVIALIANDSDFLPLVRKLNTLGTSVMLLAWNFTYSDPGGFMRETRASQIMLNEVNHPVMMNEVLDRKKENGWTEDQMKIVDDIFLTRES